MRGLSYQVRLRQADILGVSTLEDSPLVTGRVKSL